MDTTHLEYTAEDLISHKLMQAGILVAKPKFDGEGTDLIAFLEIADGAKFCRIQCKGRSIKNSKSNIKIPASYVTPGFVVFLYVEDEPGDSEIFCFFACDIHSWSKSPDDEFQLSLAKSNFRAKLKYYSFDSPKVQLIRTLIEHAEVSGEFRHLVYGGADIALPNFEMEAHCTV